MRRQSRPFRKRKSRRPQNEGRCTLSTGQHDTPSGDHPARCGIRCYAWLDEAIVKRGDSQETAKEVFAVSATAKVE